MRKRSVLNFRFARYLAFFTSHIYIIFLKAGRPPHIFNKRKTRKQNVVWLRFFFIHSHSHSLRSIPSFRILFLFGCSMYRTREEEKICLENIFLNRILNDLQSYFADLGFCVHRVEMTRMVTIMNTHESCV